MRCSLAVGQFYTLTLTHSRAAVRAHWKLYRGPGAQPQLIWEHATNDVLLVSRSIQADIEQVSKVEVAPKSPGLISTTGERRAINLNTNLSNKLRHLFIDAQDNLLAGTRAQGSPEATASETAALEAAALETASSETTSLETAALETATQEMAAVETIALEPKDLETALQETVVPEKAARETVAPQPTAAKAMPLEVLEPSTIFEYVDLAPGRELLQQLFVNEHGVFSYPAFLFFLEREYYEAIENNAPITLVVFSAKDVASVPGSASTSPFLAPVFLEVSKRLKQTQRKTDILAQYEQNKFAVLLPDTSSAGGKSFVRRVEKALQRIEAEPGMGDNSLQCTFGIATLGEHCQTLPALLAFADAALQTALQLGSDLVTDEDVLLEQSLSGYQYLSKSIDLRPTQQLVSQFVYGGIFTYPVFLAFLEHEYHRSARKKRELVVLVFKVRIFEGTFDEPKNMLPLSAYYEVIRRLGTLLTKRDILAHYGNGNFVILRSNTSAAQMESFARRAYQDITSEDWLTPECPGDSLRILAQVCSARPHQTTPGVLGLIPVNLYGDT